MPPLPIREYERIPSHECERTLARMYFLSRVEGIGCQALRSHVEMSQSRFSISFTQDVRPLQIDLVRRRSVVPFFKVV